MRKKKCVVNPPGNNFSVPLLSLSCSSARIGLIPVSAGVLYLTSAIVSYSVSVLCHNTSVSPMPFISDVSTQRPESGFFALFSCLAAAAAAVSIQLLHQLCHITGHQPPAENRRWAKLMSQENVNDWRRFLGLSSCLAMFLLCIFPQDRPSTLTGCVHVAMSFLHAITQYLFWMLYVVFELQQRQQRKKQKEKSERCRLLIWSHCTVLVAVSVGCVMFMVLRCALADEEVVQYLRFLSPASTQVSPGSASASSAPPVEQLDRTRSLYTYTAWCEWSLFALEAIGLMTISFDIRRYLAIYATIFGCSNCKSPDCRNDESSGSNDSSRITSSVCSESMDEVLHDVVVS